jgi:hypothetical protein
VAKAAFWTTSCLKLFPDLVRAFARGVLGRVDLLTSLASQDGDEPAYGVWLPAIIAITSAFCWCDPSWASRLLLGPARFLRSFAFSGLARAIWQSSRKADLWTHYGQPTGMPLHAF